MKFFDDLILILFRQLVLVIYLNIYRRVTEYQSQDVSLFILISAETQWARETSELVSNMFPIFSTTFGVGPN